MTIKKLFSKLRWVFTSSSLDYTRSVEYWEHIEHVTPTKKLDDYERYVRKYY